MFLDQLSDARGVGHGGVLQCYKSYHVSLLTEEPRNLSQYTPAHVEVNRVMLEERDAVVFF